MREFWGSLGGSCEAVGFESCGRGGCSKHCKDLGIPRGIRDGEVMNVLKRRRVASMRMFAGRRLLCRHSGTCMYAVGLVDNDDLLLMRIFSVSGSNTASWY